MGGKTKNNYPTQRSFENQNLINVSKGIKCKELM